MFRKENISLYAFSQSNPNEFDNQVYDFKPEIVIRAWQKWSKCGLKFSDYYHDYIKKCHDLSILFLGGGTMTVVFREEFSTQKEFEDMITRDANNNFVEHSEITSGAYRGSLANPKFRQYLIKYAKLQIDIGVDGIFFDEANTGVYNGARKWNFNGNEGFDDYFLREFNRYLINKYSYYTKADWKRNFKMDDNNIIEYDITYDDIKNNFNYRKYLKKNSWNRNPFDKSNPLAKEWGKAICNRPNPENDNFIEKYSTKYWKDIITVLRKYAMGKYNKNIIVTSNGIFPYVDFNCIGLYDYNNDSNNISVNYMPLKNGHLDGSKSFKIIFKKFLKRNNKISGDVPLVLFLDWPGDIMNTYYNLSLDEKKDYWQIYAAESYACGLFFAFHLKTSIPEDPSAVKLGLFNFLKEYSQFYIKNKDVYLSTKNYTGLVKINNSKIEYNMRKKIDCSRFFLHLINHNYDTKIITQNNIKIQIEIENDINLLKLISPDHKQSLKLNFIKKNGIIEFIINELKYYNIIIFE
jgi:hypothetical protein